MCLPRPLSALSRESLDLLASERARGDGHSTEERRREKGNEGEEEGCERRRERWKGGDGETKEGVGRRKKRGDEGRRVEGRLRGGKGGERNPSCIIESVYIFVCVFLLNCVDLLGEREGGNLSGI